MPVPVEPYTAAFSFDDALDEAYDGARAVGRGVPHGVADADRFRARADRRRVERADRVRVGARRVFGHVHHGQAFTDGERDGLFREPQQLVERPIFGVEADGRRTDERASFDGDAGALRNLGNRLDVVLVRARGAVRANV